MWLRDPLPIEVSRVANVPIGGQFWDDTVTLPIDVTGYSFSGFVAGEDGGDVVYSFPVIVTSATLGMVDFVINGSSLAGTAGPKETVNMTYQIKATDNLGNSVIAVRGPLILTPGI